MCPGAHVDPVDVVLPVVGAGDIEVARDSGLHFVVVVTRGALCPLKRPTVGRLAVGKRTWVTECLLGLTAYRSGFSVHRCQSVLS